MSRTLPLLLVAAAFLLLGPRPMLHADNHLGSACQKCGGASQKGLIECVVLQPKVCYETRMKTRVVKVKEMRTQTYTVFIKKPVTREIKKERCYLEDDVKTQTIVKKKCHLVQVPEAITHPAKECKPCKGKGGETKVYGPETNHCKKRTVVVTETTKHDITYCVKVPKKVTTVCSKVETFELVPEERERDVQVCVPQVQKYPVEVKVCKMVPVKVQCCSHCAAKHGK